jgi:hypothetical protein
VARLVVVALCLLDEVEVRGRRPGPPLAVRSSSAKVEAGLESWLNGLPAAAERR